MIYEIKERYDPYYDQVFYEFYEGKELVHATVDPKEKDDIIKRLDEGKRETTKSIYRHEDH